RWVLPCRWEYSASSLRAVWTFPLGAGSFGHGQGFIPGRAVHVLLDDAPALIAKLTQQIAKSGKVHTALSELAEYSHLHGRTQRDLLDLNLSQNFRVDRLE